MADIIFPASLPMPDLPFGNEQYEDPGYRSDMSDGSSIGRRRFTKRRLLSIELNWQKNPLTMEQYQTLQAFFETAGGSSCNFYWTHPVTGKVYDKMYVKSQGSFNFDAGEGDVGMWYGGGVTFGEA